MDKIRFRVCTGTTCYVLGASQLLAVEEWMPEDMLSNIEMEGSTCMGFCKEDAYGKPPFVFVGKKLLSEASPNKILSELNRLLEEGEADDL